MEGARIAKWLHERDRIKQKLTKEDYLDYFAPGVQVHEQHLQEAGLENPFCATLFRGRNDYEKIPEGLLLGSGTKRNWFSADSPARFNFPYRMQINQPWPEKGDLEKPWTTKERRTIHNSRISLWGESDQP